MFKFFITIFLLSYAGFSNASPRSDLNQKIIKQYGEALDDAQKQKTAGLLRSAAAKAKAEKAQKNTKTIVTKVSDKLNEVDRLINEMETEIQKADVS